MIQLRPVTKENFQAVIDLKIKESQAGMLNSNLYSMAQAKVDERLEPLGIYDNDTLVGFALLQYFDDVVPSYVFVKRYMIDGEFQNQGYGKAALQLVNDYIKSEGYAFAELMHYPENELAAHLYSSMGYELTGFIREGEPVRRLYFN